MIADGTGHKREQVRMGVLTKSGRADYIVIGEKTGKADFWENTSPAGDWGWKPPVEFAAGPKNTIESNYGW